MSLLPDEVMIVDYDPAWRDLFEQESLLLQELFGRDARIEHVGSTAVREFIDLYQPDICVTGHIHEAKGEDRIGRTHVLNPGPLSQGGYVELIEGEGGLKGRLRQVRG